MTNQQTKEQEKLEREFAKACYERLINAKKVKLGDPYQAFPKFSIEQARETIPGFDDALQPKSEGAQDPNKIYWKG